MCQYSNQKELSPLSPYRCLLDPKLPLPRSTSSQPQCAASAQACLHPESRDFSSRLLPRITLSLESYAPPRTTTVAPSTFLSA
jgi:hypothetical protein